MDCGMRDAIFGLIAGGSGVIEPMRFKESLRKGSVSKAGLDVKKNADGRKRVG